MTDKGKFDREQLVKQFGDLLNALEPHVESRASREGLTVTLRFDSTAIDKPTMRKLAMLIADSVA